MLASYDRAMSMLADVLKSTDVREVAAKHFAFEHIKLHARQVQDRELLAQASEFQMRAERWLGVLLDRAQAAGAIAAPGRRWAKGETKPATLKELGIKPKLSMTAKRAADLGQDEFEALVVGQCDKIRSGKAILVDPIRQGDKKEHRATRERELAANQAALPDKRYGVIYADPEWRFEVFSRETGMDRAADNHYPTSETDVICARPVQDISADDCVLFLWATVPMLPDALRVMAAWGFTYKSHCIWVKNKIGTGYWFRNKHELLLVGVKGDHLPAPAMGTQFPSVIEAPLGDHSEKPDAFYELIEAYFPTLAKIELNARRTRDGWQPWGLEAGVMA